MYKDIVEQLDEIVRPICYDFNQECRMCPLYSIEYKDCLVGRAQTKLEEM